MKRRIFVDVARITSFGMLAMLGSIVALCSAAGEDAMEDGRRLIHGRVGVIDTQGRFVIPPQFDGVEPFSQGRAQVNVGFYHGYIDSAGKVVIPAVFDASLPFSEGLAAVEYMGKWGFIDTNGEVRIPYQYAMARSFSDGYAQVTIRIEDVAERNIGTSDATLSEIWADGIVVSNAHKASSGSTRSFCDTWIDKSGQHLLTNGYDKVGDFCESLAFAVERGRVGFIDRQGHCQISFVYDKPGVFREGLANVAVDHKWGYIDKKGKTAVPFIYDHTSGFMEGMGKVEIDGKCGFVNTNGNLTIPVQYLWVTDFSEGLAGFRDKEGKYGFIDKTGKVAIDPVFDDVSPGSFRQGFAAVKLGDKWGFIDTRGRIVIDIAFRSVSDFSEGLASAEVQP